jgi:hypothetical protein
MHISPESRRLYGTICIHMSASSAIVETMQLCLNAYHMVNRRLDSELLLQMKILFDLGKRNTNLVNGIVQREYFEF